MTTLKEIYTLSPMQRPRGFPCFASGVIKQEKKKTRAREHGTELKEQKEFKCEREQEQ